MTSGSKPRRVTIFDTTLRDGEQAPGNAMSVLQKLNIARQLETLGVNTIEAGFPAASENDFAAVCAIADHIKSITICVFARANATDIERAASAVDAAVSKQIEILGAASDIHLGYKRQISRQQALDEIGEAVRYARRLGFDNICVAPEDASRADPTFLAAMCQVSAQAGATMITIPDTVGCLLPSQVGPLIEVVRRAVPPEVKLAMHAHDDLGLAVANTLASIEAGIDEIQVTLCGVGERAGNCSLEEVVATLATKPDVFNCRTTINLGQLYAACRLLIEEINLPIARGKAIIGDNAFATAAGLHQAAIIRNPITYEFLDPSVFGAERRMVISRHSGRHALSAKLESLGIPATPGSLERIYQQLTAVEEPVCSDSGLRSLVASLVSEEALLQDA